MIAIVGPTAAGKSELALRLAEYFPLEIISADSRQVYRHMDIGTNKPGMAERAAVPHHVIDVVDPDQDFSLAMYHQLAIEALEAIRHKSKLPLLVGGSGLYVWSLIEGWRIPQVPPDQKLRHELEARAEQEGSQSLYRELENIDPVAAEKINPGNVRRIIRALEIYRTTGQPPSQLRRKQAAGCPALIIGLTQQRNELYEKIDRRVDEMIRKGLVEEVQQLLKNGYSRSLPSMSGIGYKQISQYLAGEMTLREAIDKIKYETHRLARHQYAWFRLGDSRIHWLGTGKVAVEQAKNFIESFTG
ncbi:MAG: tRNA (adenosine(37)-N6)-dimethylallyltransferase MiaA [Dehalococcoidia bacterium]